MYVSTSRDVGDDKEDEEEEGWRVTVTVERV